MLKALIDKTNTFQPITAAKNGNRNHTSESPTSILDQAAEAQEGKAPEIINQQHDRTTYVKNGGIFSNMSLNPRGEFLKHHKRVCEKFGCDEEHATILNAESINTLRGSI